MAKGDKRKQGEDSKQNDNSMQIEGGECGWVISHFVIEELLDNLTDHIRN